MKTELVETADLVSQLTIVLETTDYQAKFEADLKKQRQKAHLKGFRKGKTPMSAVRKMFGKGLLSEVINEKLQKAIGDYITDNDIDILGNPLPSEDQSLFDFDPKNLIDYEFKFDLGLAPEVTVKGADGIDSYDSYVVEFGKKEIDEEVEDMLRRYGNQEEVESPIEDKDIVTAVISTQEGEDTWESEFTIMPERLTEDYAKALLGKTIGHVMPVDIYQFEKNASDDYVKKYFLKDAPEWVGKEFSLEVKGIKRLIPATLDDDFVKETFQKEEVQDVDAAREYLKKELGEFYSKQSLSITKRRILEHLIEANDYPLPDEFLKRWLVASNENLSTEQVDEEYESFSKNLKWTLIKQKLAKNYDIQITPDLVKTALVDKFKAQFAQYGQAMGSMDFGDIGERLMQNQEAVQKEYEELLAETVLDKIVENITLVEQKISVAGYKDIVEELQEQKK